jgi:lysophospholipase L1-like esterase
MTMRALGFQIAALGLVFAGILGCSGEDDGTDPNVSPAEPTTGGTGGAGSGGAPQIGTGGSVTGGSGTGGGPGAGTGGSQATGGASGNTGGTGPVVPFPSNPKSYPADDPHLLYSGRIDFSNPKEPKFSAPAVHIQAKFNGTAVAVQLADEHRYGQKKNYFDAIVDGKITVKLELQQAAKRYEIATGLPPGEHTLTLVKRTEASAGWSKFLGVQTDGELLAVAKPKYKIEFIGDSITAGSGNEAKNGDSICNAPTYGEPVSNGYLAYGPVLARALNAEYHVTAVSGIGLVRNYTGQWDARPMPEVYDLLFVQEKATEPKWDTNKYVPDAVVVALGTNDFSMDNYKDDPMTVEKFSTAYLSFLKKIRGYYPQAALFAVSSPMLGDNWPQGKGYTFATDQKTAITNVVKQLNDSGDEKVYKFFVTKQSGTGCGTHPGVAQHAATAKELGAFIQSTLGWN